MNPKIDGCPRIENANLCLFRCCLAFVWLALAKIGDRCGRLPKWVVEGSIETRRMIDANCLGLMINANHLGCPCRFLGSG